MRRFSLEIAFTLFLIAMFFALLPRPRSRPASPEAECRGNLHTIREALSQYVDRTRTLPADFMATPERGTDQPSWRVDILAYVDRDDLAQAIEKEGLSPKLVQRLGEITPPVFRCPSARCDDCASSYVAIPGRREFREDINKSRRAVAHFTGPRLLLVETSKASRSWVWTDTKSTPGKDLLGRLGPAPHDGRRAVMMSNGDVKFVDDQELERMLRNDASVL